MNTGRYGKPFGIHTGSLMFQSFTTINDLREVSGGGNGRGRRAVWILVH
jgi:hypothetical protein